MDMSPAPPVATPAPVTRGAYGRSDLKASVVDHQIVPSWAATAGRVPHPPTVDVALVQELVGAHGGLDRGRGHGTDPAGTGRRSRNSS